jgi:oligopeptide transport system ATP-binding protein
VSSISTTGHKILEVTDLRTVFGTRDGAVHAVNGVSFHLREGELLGIVGESGSGKSVTMMSLLKLVPMPPAEITSGRVMFSGRDLLQLEAGEIRKVRGGEIGFIFQDPMTSLNPVFTIGFQLMEPLRKHMNLSKAEARKKAASLLDLVGIPSAMDRLDDFPHQFSGGMRQRVMIAIALACDPKLLIADEPTTALDVTIQAQILELVRGLRKELRMSMIWITHDLGVVAGIADRVAVMYGGLIVEHAAVDDLYSTPKHPYTHALLQTLPSLDSERAEKLQSISGQPPSLDAEPTSCPFAPRCQFAFDRCHRENPVIKSTNGGWTDDQVSHDVACWWDIEKGAPRDDD